MNISEEIAELLQASGFTMTEIARRSKISRMSLYNFKHGKILLKRDTLLNVLEALEVDKDLKNRLLRLADEERAGARGKKKGQSETHSFADSLLTHLHSNGFKVLTSNGIADFTIETPEETIPVIIKSYVIHPERFFAQVMMAKLEFESSRAFIVSPLPPLGNRYEKLFNHHQVHCVDGLGLIKALQ